MKSPVVIFLYKRQHNLAKLFKVLGQAKPKELFLVADGAKTQDNQEQVTQVREFAESLIDWKCKIHKNYSHENLGLKERFRSGIDWVFEHTDRAIFLEDDCLPDSSFFQYCDQLLTRYQDDGRIITITGNNFQFGKNHAQDSYYFSRYPHVWGWATWKRVWDQYDSDLTDWPKLRKTNWLREVTGGFIISKFWKYIFDRLHAGKIDTWDYQLTYLSFKNHWLNIIPAVNLVTNVGVGEEGTNITKESKVIGVPTESISFPLKHPKEFRANSSADRHIDELVYLHPLGKLSLLIKSVLGTL